MEISDVLVEQTKERLEDYRELDRDIDNQIERLERLESKIFGLGSPEFSDMPKSKSQSNDRVTHLLHKRDELKEEIDALIQERDAEKMFFEKAMRTIRCSDQKAVIRMRYFDRLEFNDVSFLLFGSRDDYEERQETYLRRTFSLRNAAVKGITRYIVKNHLLNTADSTD